MAKEIHLWGDGSSISAKGEDNRLGGCGYVLLFGDFNEVDINIKYCDDKYTITGWEESTDTTNNREEIKAIIFGLKRIKAKANCYPIQVFSDSSYVVNTMTKRWYSNWRMNNWKNSKNCPVENKDLWEELLGIIEDGFLNITWNKVRGHSNVFYNELLRPVSKTRFGGC